MGEKRNDNLVYGFDDYDLITSDTAKELATQMDKEIYKALMEVRDDAASLPPPPGPKRFKKIAQLSA